MLHTVLKCRWKIFKHDIVYNETRLTVDYENIVIHNSFVAI